MTTAGFVFEKAVKSQEKLRLALDGPSGAGKTWTALIVATHLAAQAGGRVAFIDSERSSGRKYAPDFDFDHLTLPDFSPFTYIEAVKAAVGGGYAVVVVDSLSHAWEGTLELKDKVTRRSGTQNSYTAWREVTPVHEELVDRLTRAPAHVIVTLRTKTEYLTGEDANGRMTVQKIGLAPIQRAGVEYEFDVVGDMDLEHTLTISKTRCRTLADAVIRRPDAELAATLWDWVSSGEPVISPEQADEIAGILNDIADEQARRSGKDLFMARFGRPTEVRSGALTEAWAYAKSLAGIVEEEKPPARARGRRRTSDVGGESHGAAGDPPTSQAALVHETAPPPASGPTDEAGDQEPPNDAPEGPDGAEVARIAGEAP